VTLAFVLACGSCSYCVFIKSSKRTALIFTLSLLCRPSIAGCEVSADINVSSQKFNIKLFVPTNDGMTELWLRVENVRFSFVLKTSGRLLAFFISQRLVRCEGVGIVARTMPAFRNDFEPSRIFMTDHRINLKFYMLIPSLQPGIEIITGHKTLTRKIYLKLTPVKKTAIFAVFSHSWNKR
jgi:hypothetical protein